MKAFIDFFSSIKLAIFLLIIITLASILGTLVPQHRSPAEYSAMYGQLSTILIRLQITRLYQSGWYVTLLFLFAFNILICTLTRIPPKLKRITRPNISTQKQNILSLKIHENFRKKESISEIKANLNKFLTDKRFRIREKIEDKQTFILARKKILGIFGADIVHLGIIIILIGGIISGTSGVKFNLTISEGESLPVPGADFKIRLDEFTTEFYPNGSIRDWKSDLTIVNNNQDILNKTIEVNHPLSYNGFVFYQSSYGYNWNDPVLVLWIAKQGDESFQDRFNIHINETVKLSDGITEIKAVHFVPDFVIGDNNQVASRSNQPNNPAVLIEGYQDSERIFSGWIFSRYPDFSQIHANRAIPFSIELKDYKGVEFSGLQIAKDPGVNLIWVGSTLLMLGLLIAFYWPTQEIKIVLIPYDADTDVTAGGIANKNRESFRSVFEQIMTSLRSSK